MASSSQYPVYTWEQLIQYISCIYRYTADQAAIKLGEIEQLIRQDPLSALTELQRRHLATMCFSNVVLHYSQHHTISLDPDHLFHKMVERKFGGYCMENTGLLAIVLRSLGYHFFVSAAKVSNEIDGSEPAGGFTGMGHMVLIIRIGEKEYMVDAGFGPNGATHPLLLEDGSTAVAIAPAEMGFVKGGDPATPWSRRPWVFRIRPNPESAWKSAYCFYDVEFLREDFEVLNFCTSQHPTSLFTKKFICTRFILNETEDDINGFISMTGAVVKRNLNGNVETLALLANEAERVAALEKMFDVHLQPLEARGIGGRATEIRTS
ncbi:hypothetical protein AJ80_08018 [Polytolypa hystricis UAMH7299]|uniref:Uncharacterized protein n=1 Tax=Polytolypa hystricis (strain UAMH7299) TaxID=1447883 RepID=A0A2B7XF21_POLH7|nr:hypothetical protein AJ80_08018 [Polytolypa hystricis UAMH7299]